MRKSIVSLALMVPLVLPLVACSQTEQGAVIGGASGAAIGAAVAGSGNRAEGALVGGVVGAVAGGLIGRAQDNKNCRYRDDYGREYIARCPKGY